MGNRHSRVLLIEDNPGDARLIREMLADGAPGGLMHETFDLECADRLSTALERLSTGGIDLALLDLSLPDSQGLDTLERVHEGSPDLSIIVLTGSEDEELAVRTLQAGAQDYLLKGQIDANSLVRSIRFARERRRRLTDVQRHTHELEAREANLHNVIAKNVDGMVVVHKNGIVDFVNPAAERLFGRKQKELLGQMLGFPAVADETTELEILRKDGTRATVEMRVADVDWEGERACLASLRDITERKRMESELIASNMRLLELDELKTEFLSTASHELRTPLTAIREFVSIIRDGLAGPLTPDQTEYLDTCLRNCDRLGNLVDNVLDLQRLESNGQRFHRESTDIGTLLEQCRTDMEHHCRLANQRLELEMPDDLPPVLCDSQKIMQVLVNFVGNANKFTPEGGTITISATAEQCGGAKLSITVQDNGIGISTEDQHRVFGRFTQIGREHGPGSRGTGLGLAIAKKIVESHDGEIGVESTPGVGSRFTFTLPLYSEQDGINAFVHDRFSAATAARRKLAVVLLKLASPGEGEKATDARDMETDLQDIEKIARDTLRRRDDGTWTAPEAGIVLVAAEIGEGAGTEFLDRIEEKVAAGTDASARVLVSGTVLDETESPGTALKRMMSGFRDLERIHRTKRILIIDDDESIQELVTRALESTGMSLKIDVASNGYEGCLRLGAIDPHLVILEMAMPDFDGARVLRQIRLAPRPVQPRILAMSSMKDMLEYAKALGADRCIQKPFAIKELVDTVRMLLEGEAHSPQGEQANEAKAYANSEEG